MKHRAQCLASLLCAAALFFCARPPAVWAAEDLTQHGDTVEQAYHYRAESGENPSYAAPEALTVDGESWPLRDVRYEVGAYHAPITVTRTVTWADGKSDYAAEITETVDGETVTLTAPAPEAPAWKEETREYGSREEVPEELTVDGGTYKLQDVSYEERREPLTATATFETPDSSGSVYEFAGRQVEITGEPVWPGYAQDVAAYLGGGGYEITGAAWDGDFTWNGEVYVRTAIYTGWQYRPVWRADYRQTSAAAELAYTDSAWPEGWYEMTAIATYAQPAPEVKDNTVLVTVLAIGGGVVVLAAAVGGILAVLRRRRKDNGDTPDDNK